MTNQITGFLSTIYIHICEYFLDSAPENKLVKNKSSFTPPRGRNTELNELIKNIGKTNISACKPKGILGRDERTALMKLPNNSNIVIKEANKGGAIIIMKKEQYKNMVTKHLQSNVYEKEYDRNADTKVMKKIKKITDKYSDVLEEQTHMLSIFLDIILRPLTEKVTSYVRDDMDFLNYLPKKTDFDSTFFSFNITSLYTNIPHELGIEAISYWIEQFPDFLVDDRFTKDFITEALRLVLEK